MAYFHGEEVVIKGGIKRRPMMRLTCETLEEMKEVGKRWPTITMLNYPKRGRDQYRRKDIPTIYIDEAYGELVSELDACPVDDFHIRYVTYLLRRDVYERTSMLGMTKEADKFFREKIRGSAVDILRHGYRQVGTENEGLKNLYKGIENLDLGHSSYLKRGWTPGDPDPVQNRSIGKNQKIALFGETRQEIEASQAGFVSWDEEYRKGSPEKREAIIRDHPFLRYLAEKYPKPAV